MYHQFLFSEANNAKEANTSEERSPLQQIKDEINNLILTAITFSFNCMTNTEKLSDDEYKDFIKFITELPISKKILIKTLVMRPFIKMIDFDLLINQFQHLNEIKLMYYQTKGQDINTLITTVNHNNLQKITLQCTDIKMNNIVQMLNDKMTYMDLTETAFTDNDIYELAEALNDNNTLQNLVLINTGITDVGAMAIAAALKVNTTLTTINLRDNDIGDEGARAIAEALKSNNTLNEIDLTGNKVTQQGINILKEALKDNCTIYISDPTDPTDPSKIINLTGGQ